MSSAILNVILAGRAVPTQPSDVQNVVVEDVILQNPGDFTNGAKARLIAFEGVVSGTPAVVYPVKSSVIRGCDIDGGTTTPSSSPITAISPGLSLGVVIEENQIYNCNTGIDAAGVAVQDLVIWDNFIENVSVGMNFSWTSTSPQAKRLVVLTNTISLYDASGSSGIKVSGSGTSSNFLQLVVRRNIIRNTNFNPVNQIGPGISVTNVQEAVVEDNVVNNCLATGTGAALFYDSTKGQYMKSFNNQTTAGALMRAYDNAASRPLPELTDWAEDSLLAF